MEDYIETARNSADDGEKRDLYEGIRQELGAHFHVEETLFYPALSGYQEFEGILDQAYRRHEEIQELMSDLKQSQDSEEFGERFEAVMSSLLRHFEEEEARIFPRVRRVMNDIRIRQLGMLLADAKETYFSENRESEVA